MTNTVNLTTEKRQNESNKIAIVGMSCLFPEAPDLAAFWTNIVNGSDCTRDATASEWDPERFFKERASSFEDIYCKRGGFLTGLGDFDPLKYGVMPNSIHGSDPDQLLALKVASEALLDARYDKRRHPNNTHEVILGRTSSPGGGCMNMIHRGHTVNEVMNVVRTLNPSFTGQQLHLIEEGLKSSLYNCNSDTIPAVMPNVLAGRIAGRLGFKGRSLILDAACASSLVAVEIAVRDLLSGQCDLALAGGLHVNAFAIFYQMFCGLGALSRQQQIRPFDDKADGTILGEGLGMVVLKRLEDARRDNDRIYAIICGIGTSSDGQGTSMLAPSADGEALALARAYEMAGLSPHTVELLEAHGTGTPTGDAAEMQAIEKVFGTAENDAAWCAIGSVKSMIGHCQAASGIAGLIKTALSLYHRILPPTLNVDTPTSQIDWSTSACYVNTQTRSWIHPKVHPNVPAEARAHLSREAGLNQSSLRRAAVSAFGFGGVNAHAVLEEYDDEHESDSPSLIHLWEAELCLFVGATPSQLVANLKRVAKFLSSNQDTALRHVAYSLAQEFEKQLEDTSSGLKAGSASRSTLAIVARSVPDLLSKIEQVLSESSLSNQAASNQAPFNQSDVYYNPGSKAASGKLSFVLPGLGAAYPNMLMDLCLNFPDVRAVFDFVDELAGSVGDSVIPSRKIFPRPFNPTVESTTTLAAMDSAVVIVLMAEWALYIVLKNLGIQPDALLGCSTGEFAALNMSGASDILTAASMFYRLSTKVSRSVPKDKLDQLRSVMVLADYDRMADALKGIEDLYLSAALSPTQTILSGSQEAVASAVKVLEGMQLQSIVLPTAIPYHTPLVSGFIDPDNDEITKLPLQTPQLPTWSCSQVGTYSSDMASLRRRTTELFTQPILLKKTVEAMYAAGVTTFVEVGPKGVLTPLISDILRGQEHVAVATDGAHCSSLTQLLRCLAELASHGFSMKLGYLFVRRACQSVNFDEPQKPRKSTNIKLDLQYPEVRLSRSIAEQVLALNPPSVHDAAGNEQAVNEARSHGQVPLASGEETEFQTVGLGAPADEIGPPPEQHLSQPSVTGDPVLETFLTNMVDFHKNLMGMHEHVMSAYLSEQESQSSPVVASDQALPLIRTGLVNSAFSQSEAVADVVLTLSSHRYLLDHAIGGAVSLTGPEPERVHLMPLTVALEMMSELASVLMPDLRVIGMSEIRASRRIRVGWSGCTVRVVAQKMDGNAINASIDVIDANGASASATPSMQCRIHFGTQYASAPPLSLPADTPRSPRISPLHLYTAGTMFHGPRMQSVTELTSAGKKITSANVIARPASDWFVDFANPSFVLDPLLLDNSTQPVLFHLFENNEDVSALLPFLAHSLELFVDLSALRGFTTRVYASLLSVTSRGTEADVFITDSADNVLAKISSITSRRIILSAEWKQLIANAAGHYLSKPAQDLPYRAGAEGRPAAAGSPKTALLNFDQLPDDEATLNWCLDYILNPIELEGYYALSNLPRKREWVAGRIAAKDAVRRLLAEFGLLPCPCDVIIGQHESGQPFAYGQWTEQLQWVPLISISHKGQLAAAVAASSFALQHLGIDVETIEHKEEGFERLAFHPEELQFLNQGDEQALPLRLTQIWCAKEAAGKALGVGLSANPKSLSARPLSVNEKRASFAVSRADDAYSIVVESVCHNNAVIALASGARPRRCRSVTSKHARADAARVISGTGSLMLADVTLMWWPRHWPGHFFYQNTKSKLTACYSDEKICSANGRRGGGSAHGCGNRIGVS